MNASDDIDRQFISLLQTTPARAQPSLARKLAWPAPRWWPALRGWKRSGVVAGYGRAPGRGWSPAPCAPGCSLSVMPRRALPVLRALSAMPRGEEVSA